MPDKRTQRKQLKTFQFTPEQLGAIKGGREYFAPGASRGKYSAGAPAVEYPPLVRAALGVDERPSDPMQSLMGGATGADQPVTGNPATGQQTTPDPNQAIMQQLMSKRFTAETGAVNAQADVPNPRVQQLRAQSKLAKALADFQELHPSPQQEALPQDVTGNYPNRQETPIPQQAQPEVPLAGLIASTIGGFAVPQAAGGLLNATLTGANVAAQQENERRKQVFQWTIQQRAAAYEDALQKRNDALKLAAIESSRKYENAKTIHDDLIQRMTAAATGESQGQMADTLDANSPLELKSALAQLGATQSQRAVGEEAAAQTAKSNVDLKLAQMESGIYKTLAGVSGRANEGAANRTSREGIADKNITSRETIASDRNAAMKEMNTARINGAAARTNAVSARMKAMANIRMPADTAADKMFRQRYTALGRAHQHLINELNATIAQTTDAQGHYDQKKVQQHLDDLHVQISLQEREMTALENEAKQRSAKPVAPATGSSGGKKSDPLGVLHAGDR